MPSVTVTTSSASYPVVMGHNLPFGELLRERWTGGRVCIISDDRVFSLYGELTLKSLRDMGYQVCSFTFPNGEASKNLSTLTDILHFLATEGVTKADLLCALGGGVVGDITGFAAAVYLRGIPFVQLPTTFLAAIDSSVGGKTGVDLPMGKNLVGAFHQPLAVFCDTELLKTTPPEVFADGMAEAIKYGVIADEALFRKLSSKQYDLTEICHRCVEIKASVVGQDEFDTGLRRILNFGHTAGHAIEALSDYRIPHGHAVGVGMVMMARAAESFGLAETPCAQAIVEALTAHGLPTRTDFSPQEIAARALSDKKRLGDRIFLVIPRRIGHAVPHPIPVRELETWMRKGVQ